MTRALIFVMLLILGSAVLFSVTTQESGGALSKLRGPSVDAPQPAIDWRTLGKLRVVFGHQSVGDDILRGMAQLATRDGTRIEIREGRTAPVAPGIKHFAIGSNGDPHGKIRDFSAAIDAGAARGADVAMMKLCYVDFDARTDAQQVANDYIAHLDSLAQQHPATRFVAVTVPLMAVQSGPRAWIKQLLGRSPSGYEDNVRRAEFNAALRLRYASEGHLFDLAGAESAGSDGTGKCCIVNVDGLGVEALNPELTHDGGHLNERGQAVVASALLRYLGFLASRPARQVAG